MGFELGSVLDAPLEIRENSFVFAFESKIDVSQTLSSFSQHYGVELNYIWSEKLSKDWVESYKRSIDPVVCGDFFVRASWHEADEKLLDLIIDPELVFGTGHHGTTCGALKLLCQSDLKYKTVLDVGSGSGILAIAAAKLGAIVSVCDTDAVAVEHSIKNAGLNSVEIESSWVGSADGTDKEFDIVVANIVTDVLIAIRSDLIGRVKSGGKLILSGVLDRYEKRLTDAYKDLELQKVAKEGEWLSFLYKKHN